MSIEIKKIEIIEAVLQMKDEDALTSLLYNLHSMHDTTNPKTDSLLSLAGSFLRRNVSVSGHFRRNVSVSGHCGLTHSS